MIGTDPEMFLVNKSSGKLISAIGLIGGTKHKPRPINDLGDMVQEDNVAVEFNIAPVTTKAQFISSVSRVIKYINNEMEKHNLQAVAMASATFPDDQLQDWRAKEFGCEPDFNCWTVQVNQKPKADNPNLRSCGGHVHVGWDDPEFEDKVKMARALDLFIAVPSVLHDKDVLRRQLYGQAGACRWKPYGVEHRTTSNYWLQSKELMGFVFEQAKKAAKFVSSGAQIDEEDHEVIISSINKGDLGSVMFLQEKYQLC